MEGETTSHFTYVCKASICAHWAMCLKAQCASEPESLGHLGDRGDWVQQGPRKGTAGRAQSSDEPMP